MPYKILEHTADIGLSLEGKNLVELFQDGAIGLVSLITEIRPVAVERKRIKKSFDLSAEGPGRLLMLWLRELLFEFSAHGVIFSDYQFHDLRETALKVQAWGYRFDPKQDVQRYEVKAVTYHGFKLESKNFGWHAEVLFDI
ncbi:MAG: archease [Candidatus Omnitrophica bacterium]|nr:archease [Candidatus Omnitrophota bacterium]